MKHFPSLLILLQVEWNFCFCIFLLVATLWLLHSDPKDAYYTKLQFFGYIHKLVKRIQAIVNKNSVLTQSRSPTDKNNVFTWSCLRDHLPILKTLLFKVSGCLPSRCLTLHSQHPGSSSHMRTNVNAVHVFQMLWVRWMHMFIICLLKHYVNKIDKFSWF